MWTPWKTLVLHNSRETLAWLLNRRIWHLWTTYKMQNVWAFYPKYAMYVWFPVFLSRWSKMIGYDNLICNVVWCYVSCLQASLLFLFCLKLILFSLWPLLHNAQTKIAIVYMWEETWGTRDDMIPRWYLYGMVCMQWKGGSLMCTSNVADNTQMASLDRQVTQNGIGVINAMARENTMEGYHW